MRGVERRVGESSISERAPQLTSLITVEMALRFLVLALFACLANALVLQAPLRAGAVVAGRAPSAMPLRVRMCDEGEAAAEEPAAEEGSIFDTISALPAELIEKIKGLTLLEAKDLIEDVDNAFGVGSAAGKDDDDDASEE